MVAEKTITMLKWLSDGEIQTQFLEYRLGGLMEMDLLRAEALCRGRYGNDVPAYGVDPFNLFSRYPAELLLISVSDWLLVQFSAVRVIPSACLTCLTTV